MQPWAASTDTDSRMYFNDQFADAADLKHSNRFNDEFAGGTAFDIIGAWGIRSVQTGRYE